MLSVRQLYLHTVQSISGCTCVARVVRNASIDLELDRDPDASAALVIHFIRVTYCFLRWAVKTIFTSTNDYKYYRNKGIQVPATYQYSTSRKFMLLEKGYSVSPDQKSCYGPIRLVKFLSDVAMVKWPKTLPRSKCITITSACSSYFIKQDVLRG